MARLAQTEPFDGGLSSQYLPLFCHQRLCAPTLPLTKVAQKNARPGHVECPSSIRSLGVHRRNPRPPPSPACFSPPIRGTLFQTSRRSVQFKQRLLDLGRGRKEGREGKWGGRQLVFGSAGVKVDVKDFSGEVSWYTSGICSYLP